MRDNSFNIVVLDVDIMLRFGIPAFRQDSSAGDEIDLLMPELVIFRHFALSDSCPCCDCEDCELYRAIANEGSVR